MTDITQWTDQHILACTAYGENRGGGADGMQSVINTVMNRANKPGWWGTTPREVCLKPKQFDCWMPDDPNYYAILKANTNDIVFGSAYIMAQQALSGTLPDLTHGATYYIAKSIPSWPHWAIGHIPCADIAGQIFFNDID